MNTQSSHSTPGWKHAVITGLIAVGLAVAFASMPANARPAFSAFAIDARTGKVLYNKNGDSRRFPASLTKIMTLYMLFDELKAGRLKMNSKLRISKYAAGRPPSKLGLRAGSSITVRDAVRALVTKSANDIATAVGENLAGSEVAFAKRMTAKARWLGMTRTTFKNASGLPNSAQVTTARDMATLALRIHRDHPRYYRYFATKSFRFGRRNYRNHNRLLGRVSGVDGIKTGYTRASGYNLTTSAKRNRKRVVAVVMGARSGRSRNAYMTKLINRMFKTKRLARGVHLARLAGNPPGYVATRKAKVRVAANSKVIVPPLPKQKPASGKPVLAAVQPGLAFNATTFKSVEPSAAPQPSIVTASLPNQAGNNPVLAKSDKRTLKAKTEALAKSQAPVKPDTKIEKHLKSWNIQIGAFPSKDSAQSRLDLARSKGLRMLRGKSAFTMKISSGNSTLFRARFSGFNRKSAFTACKALKKRGVGCFALAPKS